MATKENFKTRNPRNVQDVPFDREDIIRELLPEFTGTNKLDKDIAREGNVIDPTAPSEKEIKDREGIVDRNQFGTIELPAGTPRKHIVLPLTVERITLNSVRKVLGSDIVFEHFALK